jgi:hypothetical protein
MTNPGAGDEMTCRACGKMERASEGYPCSDCGTFVCIHCEIKGVTRCKACQMKAASKPA